MPRSASVYVPDARMHIYTDAKKKFGSRLSEMTVDYWETILNTMAETKQETIKTKADIQLEVLAGEVYESTFGDIENQSEYIILCGGSDERVRTSIRARFLVLADKHPDTYGLVKDMFVEKLPRLARISGYSNDSKSD